MLKTWLSICIVSFIGLSLGCNNPEKIEDEMCTALCDELVKSCQYDAFPSYSSCMDGCFYNIKQGADIETELSCVEKASCNTFQIVECENQHGVINED
jgi:hypothetical protein